MIWFNQKILQTGHKSSKSRAGDYVKRECRFLIDRLTYTDDSTHWAATVSNSNWDSRLRASKIEDYREFVKEHSFPRLVSSLHVLLYNDTRHYNAPWKIMTHPRAAERLSLGCLYSRSFHREMNVFVTSELRLADLVKKSLYHAVFEISRKSNNMRESLACKHRKGQVIPAFRVGILGRVERIMSLTNIQLFEFDIEPSRWNGLFSSEETKVKKKKKKNKNKKNHSASKKEKCEKEEESLGLQVDPKDFGYF